MDNKPLLVILGAGPGVSAGIARKFGINGFKVILLSRKQQSLDLQLTELQLKNIESYGIIADSSEPKSVIAAFDQIQKNYGTPDVLVYNAGANSINDPSVLSQNELMNDFTVNVAEALISAQQVIPQMKERKSGTIIFTGGMLALIPVVSRASASISKAGLRNLTFTLADELSPFGIHVATVTIGGVVKEGTFYDPDLIAEAYWEIFTGKNQKEILYKEK